MSTIRRIPLSPSPWRVSNVDRGTIIDQNDAIVARLPKAGPLSFETRSANLSAIVHAPQLLQALREAAYWLHVTGVPANPEFYDLIDRASAGMPAIPRLRTPDPRDANSIDTHYISPEITAQAKPDSNSDRSN